MCEPTLVLMAAGTALSAAGSIQQGKAAKAAGRYQNQVAQNNKAYMERMAVDTESRGRTAEMQHRQRVGQLKSRQRSVMSANGILLDDDTALEVLEDTAELGEFDALTIRSNYGREAYGQRVKGMNFESEGALAQAEGKAANQAGMIGAGSTLLTGSGQVHDKWYRLKNA